MTIARALDEHYALGIKPDWWKLEPQASATAWENISAVIARNDPWCRGVVLLGLDAPEAELARGFAAVAPHADRQGLRGGPHHFQPAPQRPGLAAQMTDEAATADMATRFDSLVGLWNRRRQGGH